VVPRSDLAIAAATSSELDATLAVLDDAAAWLQQRGVDQWRAGQWKRERIGEAIDRGEVHLARLDGAIVGTISLQWSDEFFWPGWPLDAGYVHRLAVGAKWHGHAIGRALLEWAVRTSAAQGRTYVRLDCVCENAKLRSYYEGLRFTYRGERRRGPTWCAALYERPASAPMHCSAS